MIFRVFFSGGLRQCLVAQSHTKFKHKVSQSFKFEFLQ